MANNNKKQEELKKAPVKVNYPIVLAQGKGKVHLSPRLMEQINMLHRHAGNVEWSGPVLYSINKGDISTPKSFELEAHAMYPMDIGTSGYTEYDFEPEETFDMHDYYPEILTKSWDMGHMHTHHNMKAYFSSTDDQELKDNTPNHAYYFSLIVNHKGEYVARLCVMAKREIKGTSGIKYKNINGKDKTSATEIKQTQDIVYAIDLDVVYEQLPQNSFMGEVTKIQARKEVREKARVDAHRTKFGTYNSRQLRVDDEAEKTDIASWNNSFSSSSYGRDGLLPVPDFKEEAALLGDDEMEDISRDFLYRYLSNDIQAAGHLGSLLERLELSYAELSFLDRKVFIDALDFNAAYHATIPDDVDMVLFNELIEEASAILFNYQMTYQIASDIIDKLEAFYVPETPSSF
jgi:hypothetical protein